MHAASGSQSRRLSRQNHGSVGAQRTHRFRSGRKTRIAVLTTAFVAVATLAFAVLLRAPLSGGGEITDPQIEITAAEPVNPNCSVTVQAGGAEITVHPVMVDDLPINCGVNATVAHVGGGETPVIQDLLYSAETEDYYNGEGCGTEITTDGVLVTLVVRVPADAPTGEFTATADAGVYAVNAAEYVDADCPTSTNPH